MSSGPSFSEAAPRCGASGDAPVRPRPGASPAVRGFAVAVLVLGALLIVASIFADQLNLIGGGVGFGWKQLIGAIVGLVLLLLGLAWLLQPPLGRDVDESLEQ